MVRIGLTGGIGSGKSTVAKMLAQKGAVVIDADVIAREVVEPGQPALAALVEAFGDGILNDDGTLHRAGLANLAFATPEATARLNEIMHPLIAARSDRLVAEAPADAVLVYDMPLLFETGQQHNVDLVVVVDVPLDLQILRATKIRGLDKSDVMRRIAAQMPREERVAKADVVIDNDGDLGSTLQQVERLWESLTGE